MLVLFSSQKVQMLVCYWWGFSTWDTGVAVSENKSILLTFERQGVFKFGKFFKSFAGTALFLGSVLTVYQTATSKIITYLVGEKDYYSALASSSGVLWHHLQGEIGLKIKMHSLEECHWSENQVVFSLSCSVRPITFPCFWNSELNYNILEDVWGVKGTLKCLKIRKRSQRMFFALSTC